MNICACGCQQPCRKRFVHGHYGKWLKKQREAPTLTNQVLHNGEGLVGREEPIGPQSPPPHPLPYDHGKWRVCEEALGTDLTQPWQLSYCLECRLPTFTHSEKAAAKNEVVCETCFYMLMNELADKRVSKENRTRTPYNPFE